VAQKEGREGEPRVAPSEKDADGGRTINGKEKQGYARKKYGQKGKVGGNVSPNGTGKNREAHARLHSDTKSESTPERAAGQGLQLPKVPEEHAGEDESK